jgi:hypothetical protein
LLFLDKLVGRQCTNQLLPDCFLLLYQWPKVLVSARSMALWLAAALTATSLLQLGLKHLTVWAQWVAVHTATQNM